jgi:hypothetical protein
LLNYELNLTATLFVFGQRKVGKLQSEFPQPDQLPLMCRLHYYWKRKFGMHQNGKSSISARRHLYTPIMKSYSSDPPHSDTLQQVARKWAWKL